MTTDQAVDYAAMHWGEHDIRRAARLQSFERRITATLGRAETIYRRHALAFRHCNDRAEAAAGVRSFRRHLRAMGRDVARVCAAVRGR